MSYAVGGRSGNRGQCAQPCRRAYKLMDRNSAVLEENRHLLSLRDLNLSNHLGELLDAGVRSFKIEGRLKDKTYVMNVVGHYRQKLDALLEGRAMRPSSSGKVHFDFSPDPRKTFNRGFTTYFLHGRQAPVGSIDTPKSLGEPVGRVRRLSRSSFTLEGSSELHRADGLCFFNNKRELVGTTVNDVQGQTIIPERMDGLKVGTLIYRNHDHVFLNALEKSKTERKIAVRFRLAASRKGLALFALDEDGNEVMFAQEIEKVLAEKPEQVMETIQRQLRKLGGTAFECTFIRNDLPEAWFIPVSALNALRRGALEALSKQREEAFPRWTSVITPNDIPYPIQELTYRGNVLNRQTAAFYRRHGVSRIEPAAESGLDMVGRIVMTTRHCLKHELGWCSRYRKGEGTPTRVEEPLTLIDEQGIRYPLHFNCAACEMEVFFGTPEE